MKTFVNLLLVLLFFVSSVTTSMACCADDPYSVSELIMSTSDLRDILIIKVDQNADLQNPQQPITAKVVKVIKGKTQSKQVIVHNNYHFKTGEEFLLVCYSSDEINYL